MFLRRNCLIAATASVIGTMNVNSTVCHQSGSVSIKAIYCFNKEVLQTLPGSFAYIYMTL